MVIVVVDRITFDAIAFGIIAFDVIAFDVIAFDVIAFGIIAFDVYWRTLMEVEAPSAQTKKMKKLLKIKTQTFMGKILHCGPHAKDF